MNLLWKKTKTKHFQQIHSSQMFMNMSHQSSFARHSQRPKKQQIRPSGCVAHHWEIIRTLIDTLFRWTRCMSPLPNVKEGKLGWLDGPFIEKGRPFRHCSDTLMFTIILAALKKRNTNGKTKHLQNLQTK